MQDLVLPHLLSTPIQVTEEEPWKRVIRGEDAFLLDVTDVVTRWTDTRAVRNKSQEQVFAALRDMRSNLPFPLLGIHSEYGSEFMNWQLHPVSRRF